MGRPSGSFFLPWSFCAIEFFIVLRTFFSRLPVLSDCVFRLGTVGFWRLQQILFQYSGERSKGKRRRSSLAKLMTHQTRHLRLLFDLNFHIGRTQSRTYGHSSRNVVYGVLRCLLRCFLGCSVFCSLLGYFLSCQLHTNILIITFK